MSETERKEIKLQREGERKEIDTEGERFILLITQCLHY